MRFLNLTPHAIVVVGGPTIPPSGQAARLAQTTVVLGEVNGVPILGTTFGEPEGLPAPVAGTIYVVSALIRAALPDRIDLASPGELVRDGAGAVLGCRGLIMAALPEGGVVA